MLDQDKQDVRFLQELLLEDGEMHGSGRQRQFRWKNIGYFLKYLQHCIYLICCFTDAKTENVNEDCEVNTYAEDDNENEEQWRKMRFERENYLQKVVCILF